MAITAKLNAAINEIIASLDTRKRLEDLHLLPAGGSPADMRKLIQDETKRWSDVIQKAGIQPE